MKLDSFFVSQEPGYETMDISTVGCEMGLFISGNVTDERVAHQFRFEVLNACKNLQAIKICCDIGAFSIRISLLLLNLVFVSVYLVLQRFICPTFLTIQNTTLVTFHVHKHTFFTTPVKILTSTNIHLLPQYTQLTRSAICGFLFLLDRSYISRVSIYNNPQYG